MAWIETWVSGEFKESAEAARADPEERVVMFSITTNYIAEVYNGYHNLRSPNIDGDELGDEDRWGMLSDEQRKKLLDVVKDYITQCIFIDEELINVMIEVEDRAAAEALK